MRLASILAVLALAPAALAQTTWYVDLHNAPPGTGTEADPYSGLQYAIDRPSTVHGDTILVAAGTYVGPFNYEGKRLTIESIQGPDDTILSGSATDRIINLSGSPCTLRGFTVRGALAPGGMGVLVAFGAAGHVERCVVRGNNRGIENWYDVFVKETTIVNNATGVFTTIGSGNYLDNTIVWNNVSNIGGYDTQFTYVAYCAGLSPTWQGNGNIIGDPLLVDTAGGDYRLRPDSPCIDAGDPSSPLDPDGSRIDIGAFTYWPAPVNYCTALPNSTGNATALFGTGSTSIADNDFTLQIALMPPFQTGIFIYSPDQAQTPLGNGNLCLGTQTQGFINRLPGGQADSLGFMTLGVDLTAPPIPQSQITPGSTWNFQAWHRDAVGSGFNFSDGLQVQFAP